MPTHSVTNAHDLYIYVYIYLVRIFLDSMLIDEIEQQPNIIVLIQFFNYFFHKNHKTSFKYFFPIFFPPEGNFDIDAGDGGGGVTI